MHWNISMIFCKKSTAFCYNSIYVTVTKLKQVTDWLLIVVCCRWLLQWKGRYLLYWSTSMMSCRNWPASLVLYRCTVTQNYHNCTPFRYVHVVIGLCACHTVVAWGWFFVFSPTGMTPCICTTYRPWSSVLIGLTQEEQMAFKKPAAFIREVLCSNKILLFERGAS